MTDAHENQQEAQELEENHADKSHGESNKNCATVQDLKTDAKNMDELDVEKIQEPETKHKASEDKIGGIIVTEKEILTRRLSVIRAIFSRQEVSGVAPTSCGDDNPENVSPLPEQANASSEQADDSTKYVDASI